MKTAHNKKLCLQTQQTSKTPDQSKVFVAKPLFPKGVYMERTGSHRSSPRQTCGKRSTKINLDMVSMPVKRKLGDLGVNITAFYFSFLPQINLLFNLCLSLQLLTRHAVIHVYDGVKGYQKPNTNVTSCLCETKNHG